jgi:hypothetical protein
MMKTSDLFFCILTVCVSFSIGSSISRADSPYLYGIHWWGYDPDQALDTQPAALLDCPEYGGWDVEIVLTHSEWGPQAAYYQPLYQKLYTQQNMSIITRIDYNWGQTVPAPSNPDQATWPNDVVNLVNTLGPYAHIWQVGNEPNILGEGHEWPDQEVTPAGYAQVYQSVRQAVHTHANPSPAGDHVVLVAPPSPGPATGPRWMDGTDWLGQVIDHIPNDQIDGFALHSYGGTASSFMNALQEQLAVIDSKGLHDRPVYVTEWNRYSDPANPEQEKDAARFCKAAFTAVNDWNQTKGNHNIICLAWFIYDADNQAGGGWNGYSIEYWKDHGVYTSGSPYDLYTAFEQAVESRYPAGRKGKYIADFSATPTYGVPPVTVQFTDESAGTPTGWTWDFGDGNTSNERNPEHTYTSTGNYTVSLTVTGGEFMPATETKVEYMVIRHYPGDFDKDQDVDMEDFGFLQKCLSGENISSAPVCDAADMDKDGDLDQEDMNKFIDCLSGPNVPADLFCSQ